MLLREKLRSADIAGRHAIYAHPAACEFDGKTADQAHDACFGRGVVHMLAPAVSDTHDRGKCHDGARAALDHARDGRSYDPQDTLEVDVESVVPLFVRHGAEWHAMGDAGVGDHDIDRAEALFSIRDDGVCLRRVGEVEVPEVGTATLAADFVGDGVAFCLEHVGDDDMAVLVGEGQCRRAPDANSSTRDQYDSLRHFDLKRVIPPELNSNVSASLRCRSPLLPAFRCRLRRSTGHYGK